VLFDLRSPRHVNNKRSELEQAAAAAGVGRDDVEYIGCYLSAKPFELAGEVRIYKATHQMVGQPIRV
jgi:hypothetical protein